VLLQQTRVAQATPYYRRFLRAFPTVSALARAPSERVLKVWEGAGYYARARHLHEAARRIVATSHGRVPRTVPELEELPGVGPYIARAVASLAFDVPVIALEANGLRVAARWTLERGDIRAPATRHRLGAALESMLPPTRPGAFNEAIMELGETICRPTAPRCGDCPVARGCRAVRELSDPSSLPRRPPRRRPPRVVAAVSVIEHGGRWLVQQRPPRGLLGGLWEFPGGKVEPGESPATAARRELREETGVGVGRLIRIGAVQHTYSHFSVLLHVFWGRSTGAGLKGPKSVRRWLTPREFGRLPRPRATEKVVRMIERSALPSGRTAGG